MGDAMGDQCLETQSQPTRDQHMRVWQRSSSFRWTKEDRRLRSCTAMKANTVDRVEGGMKGALSLNLNSLGKLFLASEPGFVQKTGPTRRVHRRTCQGGLITITFHQTGPQSRPVLAEGGQIGQTLAGSKSSKTTLPGTDPSGAAPQHSTTHSESAALRGRKICSCWS